MTYRLLSDRELRNFSRFIRPNPQGAFDAAPKASKPAHLARLRKGVPLSAFGRGGAYDAAPEDDLSAPDRAVLVELARELSDTEWLALKRTLCGEDTDTDADDADPIDQEDNAPAMDARSRFTSHVQQDRYPRDSRPAPMVSADAAKSFYAMYPNAAAVRKV